MANIKKPRVIAILGPTASGKSDLAIFLAQKFSGEIISADSRQVYQRMNIGTGKVSKKEQRVVRHHLIDVVSPKKEFSVSDFKLRSKSAVSDIAHRGKLPIICGGTGLYVDALIYDLEFPAVPPNKKLRAKLEKRSAEQLFKSLQKKDHKRAKMIDRHNKRRLIRALEIIEATGKVPPLNTRYQTHKASYEVLWLGLNPKNIDARIKKRLDKRLKQGMIHEIEKIKRSGVSWKRLRDFGLEYRSISNYLKKNGPDARHRGSSISFKKSKEYRDLEIAIRQYARRQMTWFKRNKKINWLKNRPQAIRLTRSFLK